MSPAYRARESHHYRLAPAGAGLRSSDVRLQGAHTLMMRNDVAYELTCRAYTRAEHGRVRGCCSRRRACGVRAARQVPLKVRALAPGHPRGELGADRCGAPETLRITRSSATARRALPGGGARSAPGRPPHSPYAEAVHSILTAPRLCCAVGAQTTRAASRRPSPTSQRRVCCPPALLAIRQRVTRRRRN